MSRNKETLAVLGSALLSLASISLLWCPQAHAASPGIAAKPATTSASPAPPEASESDLDDDRAEHWAVPSIAREERVQSGVLTVVLAGAGVLSMRRRARVKGQKPHG